MLDTNNHEPVRTKTTNMQQSTTIAQVHPSPPTKPQTASRRNRSQSRHERHKCHKHRQRMEDVSLQAQVAELKNENYYLNRRINASLSSLDSGIPTTDGLPPIDIDIKNAYQHVKNENDQLVIEVRTSRIEREKMKDVTEKVQFDNSCLRQDVLMLKNLVYRLNVELEKLQDVREKNRNSEASAKKSNFELPRYYNKNFLKPILPLLKAYSEVIQEKSEIIEQLEANFERFTVSFNELLKENETLYKELELKLTRGDDNIFDDVKVLKREIDIVKEERDLFYNQANLEAERLKEVHVAYKSKVNQQEQEKEVLVGNLQDVRSELCTLRGKQSVLKQELERLRSEDETKVPLVVHSATIGECKRLFQDLKNDHETEKQAMAFKLKEYETKLRSAEANLNKNEEARLVLEQGNFDLAIDKETLQRRLTECEGKGGVRIDTGQPAREKNDVHDLKKQLKESKKRNTELESELQKSKKQLQQAMTFAEDIVREQEGLLSQLHQKQRENSMMASQFGSLKNKLKNVEKDAQEGLNCVEDKMREQEQENLQLAVEVERLTELLRDRDIEEEMPKSETSLS